MFKFLFKTKPKYKPKEIKNSELVNKLRELSESDSLNQLLTETTCKLYLLNLYTENIEDLFNSVITNKSKHSIVAVSIDNYFNKNNLELDEQLKRLYEFISDNDLSLQLTSDIYQIVNDLNYLLKLIRGY